MYFCVPHEYRVHRDKKRVSGLEKLKLAALSVLGTEPVSCGRTAIAFNFQAYSLSLSLSLQPLYPAT